MRWWLAWPLLALLVMACSGGDEAEDLTVFAAASLRDVVEELETAWIDEHPDVPLTIATEASNVLKTQIAEGAAADVFLSADLLRPSQLAEAGLTAAEPIVFARNHVTLVVPSDRDGISTPADLSRPGVRLVGVGEGVPIASYTLEAVRRLAATMPEPEAFGEAVADNVVSREDNVRAAFAKVELGEGDAAFVYATDALGSEDVREVPLPETAAVTARYGAVQVSDHSSAEAFVRWLAEPPATTILEAAGFEVDS